MPFLPELLQYESVSVVGMEKNTGKTETLNYIIKRADQLRTPVCVTSIGVDGETTDSVTGTNKPEITLYEGMFFITSEKHYLRRRLVSEILDMSVQQTALGRLVTARALSTGKVILSGPSDTHTLRETIRCNAHLHVTTLVDGALSRLSPASPTVTQAMVLATGAACSLDMEKLVKQTAFICRLIRLPKAQKELRNRLNENQDGIWTIDDHHHAHPLGIDSALRFEKHKEALLKQGNTLFVSGVLTDRLLNFLQNQPSVAQIIVVVKDFTKVFVQPQTLQFFLQKGGQLQVLHRSKLIAVTVNPTSPLGVRLDGEALREKLQTALDIPVYDVRNISIN